MREPRISIIIPTLNEESSLPAALSNLRRQQPEEIIVVDGGSTDRTMEHASLADRLILSAKGRSRQMNAGALAACGDVLLFLHADCHLESGALEEVALHLRRSDVVAGCFSMVVNQEGFAYRAIGAAASLRTRVAGVVYGDQGMFVRRSAFQSLGGFPEWRFLEDLYFSRRLNAFGRLVVCRNRILVSPRRWQRYGVVRQTLLNWTLTSLALAGVHPDRLADFYPVTR